MGLDLLRDRGTPIERQRFHWKELVQEPISKLDADALTRVRIILMNGIESETILIAELADQDSWAALARSAEPLGDTGMTAKITQAQQTELQHLNKVRGWIEAADRIRAKAATEVH